MPSLTPAALSPVDKADIDRNTVFCLACFSSLPPNALKTSSSSQASLEVTQSNHIFTTPCCQRLICPTCIAKNPRLLRYDPCLACLGGVGVVSSSPSILATDSRSRPKTNVDGAVRDEDVFVLGDEDEEEVEDGEEDLPAYRALDAKTTGENVQENTLPILEQGRCSPSLKYYINRTDNLQGICLRYGFDGHELCRLNSLPFSTLTTNPHILHTRRFLNLPPCARNTKIPMSDETPEERRAREVKWGKERAAKRLQTLTKELDWGVAQVYVALAEEDEESEESERKRKEMGTVGPLNLEDRAIGMYLDDNEWEESHGRMS